ncbi:MAG TPA: hypothetical protein VG860_19150 [Terriglobia bacterium]|nr:hypothetical protein [Terriglobia bacterium]
MPGTLRTKLAVTLVVWVVSTAGLRAQQNDQQAQTPGTTTQAPASPAQAPASSAQTPQSPIGGDQAAPPAGEQPPATPVDTRPLAGAQEITPTLPLSGRSYLLSSFSVWQGADSNAPLMDGYSKLEVAAIPAASLNLHYVGQHNSLDVGYEGGGILYETDSTYSAPFEDVAITDQYTARRWNFFFADRFTYLPQASTGFGGIGFAGIFNNAQALGLGTGGTELNPAYIPEQSILTGTFGITSETGIAQLQYFVTPRTSVSAMGSFGYQYYSETGLLSGTDRYGVLSIDHQLSATQSVSFAYSITKFNYSGGSLAVSDNLWRVGYGYRVSNHFSLSLLLGPELTYSAIRGVYGVMQRVSWAGQGELGYHGQRGGFTLSYLHYLTPGSGVFQGAQSSVARVGVDRELTRRWSGDLSIGWVNDAALSTYSVDPFFINPGTINMEYGSARLSHDVGRYTRVFGVYELEREESGAPLVRGTTNGLLLRHIFGVGLEWHPRPLGL